MKTLVIYAHPPVDGHCKAILDNIKGTLEANSVDHELIDLYRINYDPILSDKELYTSGRRSLSSETIEFQKKISDAKELIFIYPIWWGSMPAILKGFFDKVLTPGFAFRYEGMIPQKLLKGKKAAVFITSGAPAAVSKFVLADRYTKLISNDILGFCGIESNVYQIGNAHNLDESQEKNIEKNVEKGLSWLYGKQMKLIKLEAKA